jgi:hypothetical protein
MQSLKERHFVGSQATISERLIPLIERTQADELMVLTMVHDHTARKHSYDLVAKLFDVQPAAALTQ